MNKKWNNKSLCDFVSSVRYFHKRPIFVVNDNSSFDRGGKTFSAPEEEENEFAVIQNPYYGEPSAMELNPMQRTLNWVDFDNVQIVTATNNVYYEM